MEIREDIDQLLQARSEIDAELQRFKTKQTVLFTDIVGSTTYFDRFGDTAGLLLLYRHDSLVMGAVEEFKGSVVKTIGDSVMAEFANPLSAVQAASAIQRRLHEHNQSLIREERLLIRIGINSGFGFRRANDLFGDVVNVAARITKRSGAAQILMSRSVTESLTDSDIPFRSIGSVNLDGKADAEELFEVIWTDAGAYETLLGSLAALAKQRDKSSHGARLEEFVRKTSSVSELEVEAAKAPFAPALTDRYEVMSRLGAGGMGVVYKARDRETGETVALKVLNPEIADSTPLMEIFRNEIRVARKITHKNVCRIYDFTRTDDTAFISMEFVQGETLRRVLDRFDALTTRNGIKIALEICDALHEVHTQGIVHRDVKPQNLMIDERGDVKLMDFGLAHVVDDRSTTAAGTPSYMAPEQAKGRHIDQRADIYSLGLVLFEVFTGAAVLAGNMDQVHALKQRYEAVSSGGAVEQSIPEHIARAIVRCLENDPAKRFQSVEELRSALADPANSGVNGANEAEARVTWTALAKSWLGALREKKASKTAMALAACLLVAGIVIASRAGANPPVVQASPQPASVEPPALPLADMEQPPAAPVQSQQASATRPAEIRKPIPDNPTKPAAAEVAAMSAPAEIRKPIPDNPTKPAAAEVAAMPAPPANRRPGWTALIDTAFIPAGVFMMGNDNERRPKDERPLHQVKLDAFNMSRTEITNQQYLAFLDASSYPRPKDPSFAKDYLNNYPDLPVLNVSYEDATAFCAWASKKFDAVIRLPTEAEWEYAALAGREDSQFAWGTLDSRSMSRFKANLPRGGMAVVSKDAFPPNKFGLYNMNGNVAEWVMDYYSRDYYETSPIRNPAGPPSGSKRSVKGGSWADNENEILASSRASRNPGEHSDQVGFRIVAEMTHTTHDD